MTPESELQTYMLQPGYLHVCTQRTLIGAVLGSCVAVCIWDSENGYGSMAHAIYPIMRDPAKTTVQYCNVAGISIVRMMQQLGSKIEMLEASLIGGASPEISSFLTPDVSDISIGAQNIKVMRQTLTKLGVCIVKDDVGGTLGRKLVFDTQTGAVVIHQTAKIRRSDWIEAIPQHTMVNF